MWVGQRQVCSVVRLVSGLVGLVVKEDLRDSSLIPSKATVYEYCQRCNKDLASDKKSKSCCQMAKSYAVRIQPTYKPTCEDTL